MDYETAHEITRLRRLIESAQARQARAIAERNPHRQRRAANLETAAHRKAMGIVMGDVSTYSDYN